MTIDQYRQLRRIGLHHVRAVRQIDTPLKRQLVKRGQLELLKDRRQFLSTKGTT